MLAIIRLKRSELFLIQALQTHGYLTKKFMLMIFTLHMMNLFQAPLRRPHKKRTSPLALDPSAVTFSSTTSELVGVNSASQHLNWSSRIRNLEMLREKIVFSEKTLMPSLVLLTQTLQKEALLQFLTIWSIRSYFKIIYSLSTCHLKWTKKWMVLILNWPLDTMIRASIPVIWFGIQFFIN